MNGLIYREASYKIIGVCMEVHNQLGAGFSEIVYKDALELEFRRAEIQYEREKEYLVRYKNVILPHKFYADFVMLDCIILEVKGVSALAKEFTAQCINYLYHLNFKVSEKIIEENLLRLRQKTQS